jgi:hypothetical protein
MPLLSKLSQLFITFSLIFLSSPYKDIYKTWLFKWIVYNKNLSYSKKEFIEHKLWKQHLMVIFSSGSIISFLIFVIYKLFF